MKLDRPPRLVHEFSAFRAFLAIGHIVSEARGWPLLNREYGAPVQWFIRFTSRDNDAH
jgi:hypothetical protein